MNNKHYALVDSCALMPASSWGNYRRIGIVEYDKGYYPKFIREGPHTRVVETWERLFVGVTDRCAYKIALRAAKERLEIFQFGEQP